MKADYLIDCTIDGKCSKCGNCCTDFLPMSDYEVERIRKYVKKHGIKEYRHNVSVGADITCPFRNEQKRMCMVYEVRPEICREFMCNHSAEDVMKAKFDMHRKKNVIKMRKTFFGSSEEDDFFEAFVNMVKSEMAYEKEKAVNR